MGGQAAQHAAKQAARQAGRQSSIQAGSEAGRQAGLKLQFSSIPRQRLADSQSRAGHSLSLFLALSAEGIDPLGLSWN